MCAMKLFPDDVFEALRMVRGKREEKEKREAAEKSEAEVKRKKEIDDFISALEHDDPDLHATILPGVRAIATRLKEAEARIKRLETRNMSYGNESAFWLR